MRDFINHLGNIFTKPLLRSPLHWLVSSHLMLIEFTGRKSGKSYTTPVQYYHESDGAYAFLTQRARLWWKNLQDRHFVTRIAGQEHESWAEIVVDQGQMLSTLTSLYPRMSIAKAQEIVQTSVLVRVHAD